MLVIRSKTVVLQENLQFAESQKNKLIEVYIRKTCLCNDYPLIPHFYIAKLGYAGVYLFYLFLL